MMFVLLLCVLHIHSIHGQNADQKGKRLILRGRSNPCEGRVDVYNEGKWGIVGHIGWSENNSAVVCKSLGCGTVVSSDIDFRDNYPANDLVWADDIKCGGTEQNLWDCEFPGWGVIKSSAHSHVYVNCSVKPELSLIMKGRKGCAGVVRLSTNDKRHHHLCSDEWNKELDPDRVCRELSCGTAIPSQKGITFTDNVNTIRPYKCLQDENFVWQCVDWTSSKTCKTPVSVTCSEHLHFRLKADANVNLCSGNLEVFDGSTWKSVSGEDFNNTISQKWSRGDICAQVECGGHSTPSQGDETSLNVSLNCSGRVSVSLKNNNGGQCYGAIYLNGPQQAVCANTEKIGQLVCGELGCGEFMFKSDVSLSLNWKSMSCPQDAESLWHCQEEEKACEKKAIICSESIAVRLRDGLDNCSGRAEIYYKGAWRRVSTDGWNSVHSDILCSHLQCGTSHKEGHDLFVDGDSKQETLKLSMDASCGPSDSIYKCLKGTAASFQKKFVKVICQDHQLFFVNGSSSCSGTVAVEQAEKTYALSGMEDAWNASAAEYVCQRMQCGNRRSWTDRNHTGSEWMQLNCNISNDTLDSRCTLGPASTNTTVAAEVNCTGKVTVMLTNNDKAVDNKSRCWGRVEVCRGGICGGVCGDAWGDTHSSMVCENLGCGRHIQIKASAENMPSHRVTVNSMHCPASVSDLSRCMFVLNNSSHCQERPAHVICSDSLESRLREPRDKCAGEVDVKLSGKWLPVCGDLDENLQKTVCAEMGCGTALTTEQTSSTTGERLTVKCGTNLKSIAKCEVQRSTDSQRIYRVKCSDWRRLLVLGQKRACEGPVFVNTPDRLLPISSTGWGDRESKLLCSNVGCGELEAHRHKSTHFEKWWNKTFSCRDGAHSIWDCIKEKDPPVNKQQQLDIKCEERLTINLTNGCYGEVIVNGKERVCARGWTDFMSHTLCLNLGCSNAVSGSPSDTLPTGPLHHFSCTGSEVRLLQCASQKSTCNSKPVSVICSGSLKFNLTEQCRGQIKVWHGGKWKVACMREKDETTADRLCEHFPGCGGFSDFTQRHAKTPGETLLSCDEANSLEYCTTNASCQRNDITEIYCGGYQRPPEMYYRPLPISLIAGVSVGLLLLLLAIVIALVLRKKKQRRRITDLLHGRHGFSRNTSNLARDDFQDLELRVTEERDVGMKNQANGQEKELDQASSEYDDVDEEAASLHTYREASEAPDPGGNTTDNPPPLPARDGELDDGDDYEEGYDDVAEPTAEEGIEHGVPSQSEERELSVEPDAEDYVQPDAEE